MVQPLPLHPLRRARLANGLTLQAAADKVGATKTAWCDWELGRRIPNRHFMPLVCAVVSLEPNDFYDLPDALVRKRAA